MRTVDLRGGSLKALLIFLLIAANIIAAVSHESARPRQNQTTEPLRLERASSTTHPH
jgi:hypothetical protein